MKRYLYLLLSIALFVGVAPVHATRGIQPVTPPAARTFIDVTHPPYNADNTGTVDAQPAIQACINAYAGNLIIWLPNGTYLLDSAIQLPNNTHLSMDRQAILKRNWNGENHHNDGVLIPAGDALTKVNNVTIDGGQYVSGGYNGRVISFYGDYWTIRNFYIVEWSPNSPARAISWLGNNTTIQNCTISGPQPYSGWGGAIMAGGSGLKILECDFTTGDDAVGCFASLTGSWANQDISNVLVCDCTLNSLNARSFACGVWDPSLSCQVYDVTVDTIDGFSRGRGHSLSIVNCANQAPYPALANTRNITIRNAKITAQQGKAFGLRLLSSNGGWLDNIQIQNVTMTGAMTNGLVILWSSKTDNNRNVTLTNCVFGKNALIQTPINYQENNVSYMGHVTYLHAP